MSDDYHQLRQNAIAAMKALITYRRAEMGFTVEACITCVLDDTGVLEADDFFRIANFCVYFAKCGSKDISYTYSEKVNII